jgi:hypothetical protein
VLLWAVSESHRACVLVNADARHIASDVTVPAKVELLQFKTKGHLPPETNTSIPKMTAHDNVARVLLLHLLRKLILYYGALAN